MKKGAWNVQLTASLTDNIASIKQQTDSDDIIFQIIPIENKKGCLIYSQAVVDPVLLRDHIVEPLINKEIDTISKDIGTLMDSLISVLDKQKVKEIKAIAEAIVSGYLIIMIEGVSEAVRVNIKKSNNRQITATEKEVSYLGSEDSFIEDLNINLSFIRSRLPDPNLQVTYYEVGKRSKTKIAVLAIEDIVNPELLNRVSRDLAHMKHEAILGLGQFRELLNQTDYSPFPTLMLTERPDKAIAALLEGRVVMMADHTPKAGIAPTTILDALWVPDDYYSHRFVGVLFRIIRILGLIAMLYISPLYIAITTFNPQLVRTDMILFLAQERLGVPLPTAFEVIFLEVMILLIIEASFRLPSKIGSNATVVAGIIIGQSAVQAGVVSAIAIIVVAVSMIGSFAIPGYEVVQALRIIKGIFIIAASMFGVYGFFVMTLVIAAWLNAQRSFGFPYLSPLSPFLPKDLWRDGLYRAKWKNIKGRPMSFRPFGKRQKGRQ